MYLLTKKFSVMKNVNQDVFASFADAQMSKEEMKMVKGGNDCYSESEVQFLMGANSWNRSEAIYTLELACKYAITATRLPRKDINDTIR
ncbi:MAG: hypothetical protein EAZ20_10880 [Bacteroidetes bacterium]|nr:MAG: hypothetical protein EAZ20_10880 [Bacteroidota bacterium]